MNSMTLTKRKRSNRTTQPKNAAKVRTVTPLDQPTRSDVHRLFRELYTDIWNGGPWKEERDGVITKINTLTEKFHKTAKMRSLHLQERKLQAKHTAWVAERKKALHLVKQQFLARGLTPKVKEQLERLVDE